MIRLFTVLYQLNLDNLPSTLSLFKAMDQKFCLNRSHCPNCNAKGHLSIHDGYERNLVGYENGAVQENQITVRRVSCSSCTTTSAILPDVIIPYKTYSILFILQVLKAYFFRKESVSALCLRFGISAATLYAWKKRYLSHKMLHLGKLEQYIHTQDLHLWAPRNIWGSDFLLDFFGRFGFSFLQATRLDSS